MMWSALGRPHHVHEEAALVQVLHHQPQLLQWCPGSRWGRDMFSYHLLHHSTTPLLCSLHSQAGVTIVRVVILGRKGLQRGVSKYFQWKKRPDFFYKPKLSGVLNALTIPSRIDSFREKNSPKFAYTRGYSEFEQKSWGSVGYIIIEIAELEGVGSPFTQWESCVGGWWHHLHANYWLWRLGGKWWTIIWIRSFSPGQRKPVWGSG